MKFIKMYFKVVEIAKLVAHLRGMSEDITDIKPTHINSILVNRTFKFPDYYLDLKEKEIIKEEEIKIQAAIEELRFERQRTNKEIL